VKIAEEMKKALITHAVDAAVESKSAWICGSAGITMVCDTAYVSVQHARIAVVRTVASPDRCGCLLTGAGAEASVLEHLVRPVSYISSDRKRRCGAGRRCVAHVQRTLGVREDEIVDEFPVA
jgi:hypothetical protein